MRIEIYGVAGNKFLHPPTVKRTIIADNVTKTKNKDRLGLQMGEYALKLNFYQYERVVDFIGMIQKESGATTEPFTLHLIESDVWIQSIMITSDKDNMIFYFDVFKEGGMIHGTVKEV